jgi:hypothetical protein
MSFANVNWITILIAAAAAWIFGAVYYTALANQWHTAQGKTLEQCKAENAGKPPLAKATPFILSFIAEVIMAITLFGILVHMNMFTVRAGMISGAFCWFGFVLTTIAVSNAYTNRRVMLTILDSVHWLGVLLIIGAIIGGWGR